MSSIRLLPAVLLALASLPAPAKDPVLAIGQVQGRDARSPYEGQVVTVQGVVTADLRTGLGGFFMQSAGAGDGDPATSDGLFVKVDPSHRLADLQVGQAWKLHGTLIEEGRDGATTTTLVLGTAKRLPAAPRPEAVSLSSAPDDWRAFESMQVRIDAPLTLGGTDLRYGETIASFEGPLWTPSERAVAGTADFIQIQRDNARRRLVLDDGSSQRDPASLAYLPQGTVRSGGLATGAEGIVDARHGRWRLQLTASLDVQPAARPAQAPNVPGNTRIAVFNLENLFNGDGRGGGFPTSRGARTEAQWRAQTAKLVATLQPLQADIAALMELENDGYGADSSLAQFVEALNAGGGDWRFVDAGHGPGNNPIRVGLLYRASKVTPVGHPVVLEGGPFAEHSRVPLAQAFRRGDGPVFVIAANHFKSKGCSNAMGADADHGDGASCWNATRVETARRLDAWLQSDPTQTGGHRALIVGDLNAYAQEQPLRVLREQGWVDAFAQARVASPYSYLYDGQRGRLDHALLTPSLAAHLRGAAEWHINADEADDEGYTGRNSPGPWRSSDHDPMVLGLDL
ncbi:MAG: ExeM/NucH family extracellular endonuclease [Pseudoxanthomonas sp.]